MSDAHLAIVMPAFNDWTSLRRLLPQLDVVLAPLGHSIGVVVIDDGSTQPMPQDLAIGPFAAVAWVRVVRLRRNLGHQRAIAVGLAHIEAVVPSDAVILMDSDGEDRPEEIPVLLERFRHESGERIVFAERRRRAETLSFRVFYHLYRLVHVVLTGLGVRVGNFSVIPRARLSGLVVVSELWNHYAAAVFRSRQPHCSVPTIRGHRLDGRSHMNFVALVVHGLSAISVHGDLVFVRLIVAFGLLAVSSLLGLMVVIGVRLFTDLAIPGWATAASGLLVLMLVQSVGFVIALTFLVLGSRNQAPFIPARDYAVYIDSITEVFGSSRQPA